MDSYQGRPLRHLCIAAHLQEIRDHNRAAAHLQGPVSAVAQYGTSIDWADIPVQLIQPTSNHLTSMVMIIIMIFFNVHQSLLIFLRQWVLQYYRADFKNNELKQEFWQVVETMAIPTNDLTHSLGGVSSSVSSASLILPVRFWIETIVSSLRSLRKPSGWSWLGRAANSRFIACRSSILSPTSTKKRYSPSWTRGCVQSCSKYIRWSLWTSPGRRKTKKYSRLMYLLSYCAMYPNIMLLSGTAADSHIQRIQWMDCHGNPHSTIFQATGGSIGVLHQNRSSCTRAAKLRPRYGHRFRAHQLFCQPSSLLVGRMFLRSMQLHWLIYVGCSQQNEGQVRSNTKRDEDRQQLQALSRIASYRAGHALLWYVSHTP